MVRPESTAPPVAAVLARSEIEIRASLKVKWTVEELAATLSVVAVDGHGRGRGDGIDGEAAGCRLRCRRCRCPRAVGAATETSAVLMSVPAFAVKVAV